MYLALSLYLLCAACAATQHPPLEIGALPQAAEVVARIDQRRLAVRSFVMQGQIRLVYPDGELNGDHLIQGVYPDRLRADVISPFGQPVMSLAINGQRLTVLAFRENKAYQGLATRRNLARFLGIAMSPAEVFALITGNPPLLKHDQSEVLATDQKAVAQLKLVAPGGALAQGVDFYLADYAVRGAWIKEADGPFSLACQYDGLKATDAGRFPLRVELSDNHGRTLTLDNDDLSVNSPVSGRLFDLAVPPTMTVEPLP